MRVLAPLAMSVYWSIDRLRKPLFCKTPDFDVLHSCHLNNCFTFILNQSFIHSFIHSIIYSFNHLFIQNVHIYLFLICEAHVLAILTFFFLSGGVKKGWVRAGNIGTWSGGNIQDVELSVRQTGQFIQKFITSHEYAVTHEFHPI